MVKSESDRTPLGQSIFASSISIALLVVLTITFDGCAISRLDTDGNRQIIGFVNLKMPGPRDPQQIGGETVSISTVGVLIYTTPIHSGLSIGFSREKVTGILNNVLAIDREKTSEYQKVFSSTANTMTKGGISND